MSAFSTAEARSVTKIFGRHRALHQVSLTVQAGSVTALLGPNGAGKTTLLSLFSTLSQPTRGSMHFGSLSPQEARGWIGLVSHASLTYGELSALENLAFVAQLHGLKTAEVSARHLLEVFGLSEATDRLAKTFSRGMRQRLALARALITKPSLLLLDEPFTGLDRASRDVALETVNEQRELGVITVLVSHDLSLTAELADRIVVLKRGRIAAEYMGKMTSQELRDFYADAAEEKKATSKAEESHHV